MIHSNNKKELNEEIFYCKKCKTRISGHNQYLHDEMCDDCFFKEYFPEEENPYRNSHK